MNNKALILVIDFSSDFSQLAFLNDAGEPESLALDRISIFLYLQLCFLMMN